ncbi:MAG: trypsin-like peptidase domain-containing protein [bacterium]
MNNGQHSSVVQVLVQMTLFNWVEPYKSPDQQQLFGTGFFIDKQGHLITSYHVVSGAASIQIQVPTLGKERFDAEIAGACPERDIALLKLTNESFQVITGKLGGINFLELGDSDKIKRTEKIFTLGYPLGQDAIKSTEGIVSGRQTILGESFIQITAALNPGNSGGPSIDEGGKVIGINAAIIPEAQNIGYIIPISDVRSIIEDLYKVKLLRRPLLGCDLNYGTHDMLAYLHNPEPGGLYISQVYKNMLFDKAGVQEGDMLYKINEYDIDMYGEINATWNEDKVPLADLINRFRIGDKITMVIYRKGEKREINFTFDLLEPLPIRAMFPEFEEIDYEVIGGLVLMQLSMNHVARFQEVNPLLINFGKRDMQFQPCLIVTNVLPNSQAYNTRTIFLGNIITHANDTPIKTLQEFRAAVKKNKEYLTIKTSGKKFVVLSMKKVLDDEDKLAHEHVYQKTKLVQELSAITPGHRQD